jgi:DHA2 family multidrug resistance protein
MARKELMQRAQFHQSRLVESAIPSSPNYQHTLDRVTEFFVSQGSSLITAQGHAVGWIGQTILNQSVLISYMDVFWDCSIFALLMVPLALTVRNVKQTTETAGHG